MWLGARLSWQFPQWSEFQFRVPKSDPQCGLRALLLVASVAKRLPRRVWHYKCTRSDCPRDASFNVLDFLRVNVSPCSERAQLIKDQLLQSVTPPSGIRSLTWSPLTALGEHNWGEREAQDICRLWWRWSQVIVAVLLAQPPGLLEDELVSRIQSLRDPAVDLFVRRDSHALAQFLRDNSVVGWERLLANLESATSESGTMMECARPTSRSDMLAMERLHVLMNSIWCSSDSRFQWPYWPADKWPADESAA